ncbi:MAG: VOC family protein [Candidatus Pacebacteria bacterium]|nr:VOC family protein [Candidatus Paceibacterota bacterium]
MQKENPVVWFEIYVDDMERAQKFYETVFGTSLEEMPMPEAAGEGMKMVSFPMTMEKTNGAPGALVKMQGMKAGGNGTVVYFGSEDSAIEEARVEAAGGKVLQSKMNIGEYGFAVMATDTEGNTFGIHSLN